MIDLKCFPIRGNTVTRKHFSFSCLRDITVTGGPAGSANVRLRNIGQYRARRQGGIRHQWEGLSADGK